MALISIIIPVYNAEKYLPSCLDSLIAQDYPDWEAICVNDGSSDGSASVLAAYAEQDQRIRIISQKNAGVSAARNNGLRAASGDYVTFVDADDALYPRALTAMEDIFRQYPNVDIVLAAMVDTWEDGKQSIRSPLKHPKAPLGLSPHILYAIKYATGESVAKLYKRDIIVNHHLHFPHAVRLGEDQIFVLQYLLTCKATYATPEQVYRYRHNNTSATAVAGNGRFPDKEYIKQPLLYRKIHRELLNGASAHPVEVLSSLMLGFLIHWMNGISHDLKTDTIKQKRILKRGLAIAVPIAVTAGIRGCLQALWNNKSAIRSALRNWKTCFFLSRRK